MSNSKSAKVLSDVLELFSMYMEKNGEKLIEDAVSKGEKPTPPPKHLETRYEDLPNGRVFYANEESQSGITVFYLHGGAYFMDITNAHWKLLKKLVDGANVRLIVPAYRLLPFATYREAFDLVVPLYKAYREANPDQKVILMGDSAGGGLSLAVTEQLKADGILLPDELILLSPWVDIVMDNEQIVLSIVDLAEKLFGDRGVLFRFYDDQFMILMEWSAELAYEICREFCQKVEEQGHTTVSVGLTQIQIFDTIRKNYYRAVQYCFLVKEMGGNGVKRG